MSRTPANSTPGSEPVRSGPVGPLTLGLDDYPAVRWSLWLGAGVVFGLGLGFVLGLMRPRPRATM